MEERKVQEALLILISVLFKLIREPGAKLIYQNCVKSESMTESSKFKLEIKETRERL